ncbi:MAG: metallophosphoesterase [Polyangia bacterium]
MELRAQRTEPRRLILRPALRVALRAGLRLLPLLGVLASCHGPGLRPDRPVLPPTAEQPAGRRQLVVISDLHFGLGELSPGHFDAYEDFRWADELAQFLKAIDATGRGATDLVLNGDSFELWQSRRPDCQSPDPDVGCSEYEALARFALVAQAHARELRALGSFADSGDNRVVLIPGNHDAALLFPKVAAAAVQVTGARPGRVQVASGGYWLSSDGRTFAEHGHQSGIDGANAFGGWPTPFTSGPAGRYLQRPWGEQFMREFFDRYEDRYPILDNIEPLGEAARYGLASEQLAGGAEAAQTFVRLLLRQTSPKQTKSLLGPLLGAPRWDIKAIRARTGWLLGPQVLPPADPLTLAVARGQGEGWLGRSVPELTDSQIVHLCDQRALLNGLRASTGQPAAASCPPVASAQDAAQSLQAERDSVLADRVTALRGVLRERGLKAPVQLYVFSHTHVAEAPFRLPRGAEPALVANSGAWQRTTSAAFLEAERARRGLALAATLPTLQPEDLGACYPFVRVDPYPSGAAPVPRLLSFVRAGGAWRIQAAPCPER